MRHVVISSDCHAGLPPERYRDYLDARHREAFDRDLALRTAQRKEAAKLFLVDAFNERWREENWTGLTGAWDHAARIAVLDGDGIAAEVIYPDGITEFNSPPFGADLALATEGIDPELQWAGARAHNRWLAELCQMAPERHIGLAVVPALWDVEVAVREVRWARHHGLRGILIPVMWGRQPPYHLRRYDPLWQVCSELEMPVHFHSGPAARDDYFAIEPDGRLADGAMGIYTSEVCWWLVRPLTFLIWGGVLHRHPGLRVMVTEGSCIWVPEYLALLDHRYSAHHANAKMGDFTAHLPERPSDYFRRQVGVGASVLARREVEIREQIGTASIQWGSDYPHPEGSWPATRTSLVEALRGVDEQDVAAILGGNAARFYGLDVGRLAAVADRIGPDQALFA
ncbi:MAG: amidohydrolase family protein [Myxococcota bacterium]